MGLQSIVFIYEGCEIMHRTHETSRSRIEKTKTKLFRMTEDQSDLLERVFRRSVYKSTQELFEKEFIPVLELMESKQLSER